MPFFPYVGFWVFFNFLIIIYMNQNVLTNDCKKQQPENLTNNMKQTKKTDFCPVTFV